MTMQLQELIKKLDHIQSDLDFIKGHLTDLDLVLTDDDMTALHEAEEDLKKGKTKRLV